LISVRAWRTISVPAKPVAILKRELRCTRSLRRAPAMASCSGVEKRLNIRGRTRPVCVFETTRLSGVM
jgi:hypothetical protein